MFESTPRISFQVVLDLSVAITFYLFNPKLKFLPIFTLIILKPYKSIAIEFDAMFF